MNTTVRRVKLFGQQVASSLAQSLANPNHAVIPNKSVKLPLIDDGAAQSLFTSQSGEFLFKGSTASAAIESTFVYLRQARTPTT